MDELKQNVPEVDSKAKIREWNMALEKYRSAKSKTERRIIAAENWWKLRNDFEESKDTDGGDSDWGFRTKSAWLHNIITSKHADYLEAYPMPDILPREENDKEEAWALKKILPVILKQNNFEDVYDANGWRKMKFGTSVYKTIFDRRKLNGLGDISIVSSDLLNLFWEPGITDIQASKYVFETEWVDKDELRETYPQLEGKRLSSSLVPSKFYFDDNVDYTDKYVVVDVYYKKKGKLHYAKYVGNELLYWSEQDNEVYKTEQRQVGEQPIFDAIGTLIGTEPVYEEIPHTRAEDGFYAHGEYPYVFDVLYPIEGSIVGYGYIDYAANAQTRIDLIDQAILENSIVGATPRYFNRRDGGINLDEFMNIKKKIVSFNGTYQNDIMEIPTNSLSGNYIAALEHNIQELRETSGNTETANGISNGGVTAASAIAAMQEASGKTSRSSTITTYRAYAKIIYLVIELIREFYDAPRKFRITGDMGKEMFIPFDNSMLQPQWQGTLGGMDLGYSTPIFDIDVVPEKKSPYSKISQNELSTQLYGLGFFNPQMADQALLCLGMMDFDGKDEIMRKIQANGGMYQQLMQTQMMLQQLLAQRGITPQAPQESRAEPQQAPKDVDFEQGVKENKAVSNARARASAATQPE